MRKLTVTLTDGRTITANADSLKYELNASRIKRARGIGRDGWEAEAGAIMAWCVATDNGNRDDLPGLDEWLDLDRSPVASISAEEVDAPGDTAGDETGKATPTALSTE